MQVRKWSDPVDNGANLLIPVPGGADGPGGVLVCAENFIIYKNQDHEEVGGNANYGIQGGASGWRVTGALDSTSAKRGSWRAV